MSRYITHNGQPFSGQLLKIKIQSCHFDSKTKGSSGEEQIIEISLDGTVRLAQKEHADNDARKYNLSRESTIRIFEAFSEVFGKYVRVWFRPVTGYWKVRLLGEGNEVFLYRGGDGEDYIYKGEELTDILRRWTKGYTIKQPNMDCQPTEKTALMRRRAVFSWAEEGGIPTSGA